MHSDENKWRTFADADIFPTVQSTDADDVRVWAIRLFFCDGTEKHYVGEEAFWGTGVQARNIAENTAHTFEAAGFPVKRFETELLPDE